MNSLAIIIDTILGLTNWVIIASVVCSWLISFNIINPNNGFVARLCYVLDRLTEPLYRPFRRILPNMAGIDISPVFVLLTIYFLRLLIREYLF